MDLTFTLGIKASVEALGTPGPPNLDCSVFLGSDTVFFGGQRLFFIMP
jgi:hypothetical protein